jgi:hypothetical protein
MRRKIPSSIYFFHLEQRNKSIKRWCESTIMVLFYYYLIFIIKMISIFESNIEHLLFLGTRNENLYYLFLVQEMNISIINYDFGV